MPNPRFQRYARRVLFGGFIGSAVSVGLTVYLFGVFQDALVEAFDTSVATLAFAPSLFIAVSGVLSPVIGRALATSARRGLSIRAVMSVGSLALGVGLVAVSRSPSLGIAAMAFTLLVAPGAVLLGPLLGQAMVTNWFEARRGGALGIVSAGTTIGGMLAPPLAATLIGPLGWRDAMAVLGGLALAISLPAVLVLVKDRPADVGEVPDGSEESLARQGDRAIEEAETDTAGLLRDPSLWLVGLTFGLVFSAGMISTVFTVPYATQLGLPLLGGAMVASARAGAAAAGKIALGALSDRLGVRRVLYGVVAIEVTLTLLLIQTRNPALFAGLAVAIGFVGGSPLPLKAAMVGQIFGRANFPAAMGLLQTVGLPFQLFMVPIAGLVYQASGTYAAVFSLTIPCFALAAGLLFFIRPKSQVPGIAS